ncbi:MAG: hypothetical protein QXY32_06455 [Nitrososphaerota archaeon]
MLLISGCMDLNTLKNKLSTSREELEVGLTILETHGYIEKTSFGEACRTCTLYSECRSQNPQLYKITEKGMKQVKRETEKTDNK